MSSEINEEIDETFKNEYKEYLESSIKSRKTELIILFIFGIGLLWSVYTITQINSGFHDPLNDLIYIIAAVCGLITLLFIARFFRANSEVSSYRKKVKEEDVRIAEEKVQIAKDKKEQAALLAKLQKVHGKEFGEAVYNNKVLEGMKEATVVESWGEPTLKTSNQLFYSRAFSDDIEITVSELEDWYDEGLLDKEDIIERSIKIASFKSGKVSKIEYNLEPFQLDYTKDDIISLWGEPSDTKETVLKTKTKSRWFYFPRTTRQHTTVYGYHVDFEDDLVTGFKEL